MNPRHELLLHQALDPEAPEAVRLKARVDLERDSEGRRLLAEHETLWSLMDDLDDAPAEDLGFVSSVAREADRREARQRRFRRFAELGPGLAASLLVVVAGFAWWSHQSFAIVRDDAVVRHLHLLEAIELVETRGEGLDLRTEVEILRAFDGELGER